MAAVIGTRMIERRAIAEPTPVEGILSDPRAPTTTQPIRSIRSVRGRHDRLYPRFPDRGGWRPVLGVAQVLPNGDPGGIGRGVHYRGQLSPAVERDRVEAVTQTLAGFGAHFRRSLWARRSGLGGKSDVRVAPGIAAVDIARARRFHPGAPSGSQGGLRDLAQLQAGMRGIFYDQTRTPATLWDRLMASRALLREKIRTGTAALPVTASAVPPVSSPLDGMAADRMVAQIAATGAGHALESAASPDTAENGGSGGFGSIAGLAAVGLVAWLVFR